MELIDLPFAQVGFNICYEAEIPECAATLTEQGAEIILCPSFTFTEFGFWRVRHCAQARAIENQVYFVHCCTGGAPGAPLPNGWAQSSILTPCDTPWTPSGIVAEATRTRRWSSAARSTSTSSTRIARTASRRRSATGAAARSCTGLAVARRRHRPILLAQKGDRNMGHIQLPAGKQIAVTSAPTSTRRASGWARSTGLPRRSWRAASSVLR